MQILVSILPWVVIFGVFWFLFIRPQKQKQQKHQEMLSELTVGDDVITIGGIKGTITNIEDNDLKIKISSDVEIEIIRSAIRRLDSKELEE